MIENSSNKPKLAVLFGGASPEHDVSIITGLQALEAVDRERYAPFPVYITPQGKWLVGEKLRSRQHYLPAITDPEIISVRPDVTGIGPRDGQGGGPVGGQWGGQGVLRPEKRSFWQNSKPICFDIALLAFHGAAGESGPVQGLLELMGVPYTGLRVMGSAVAMDKVATKSMLAGCGIPLLPHALFHRPLKGLIMPEAEVRAALAATSLDFPLILKPAHLGSSIGVVPVKNMEELLAVLPICFRLDHLVMAEPLVPHLAEFNIAVRRNLAGDIETSAIEQPHRVDAILDFKQKYKANGAKTGGTKSGGVQAGDQKSGNKQSANLSEGMLSLTRTLNPKMPEGLENKIKDMARRAFAQLHGTGAPRLDFLYNSESNECWLNEINPIPGSFGFFLWEARQEQSLGFTALLNDLLAEAKRLQPAFLADDPVPVEARLFQRK